MPNRVDLRLDSPIAFIVRSCDTYSNVELLKFNSVYSETVFISLSGQGTLQNYIRYVTTAALAPGYLERD